MQPPWVAPVLGLIGVSLSGCGADNLPTQATHPAKGAVTLDGLPVNNATVVLHPLDAKRFKLNERPQGKSNARGEFTLFTYKEGDGAPKGEYKAGIALIIAHDSGDDQVKRGNRAAFIPFKYHQPETSGLSVTIKTGANQIPPFILTTK